MIKEKLVDEESKIIYEALLEYSKTEDYISFWDNIKKIDKEWFILDSCFEQIQESYRSNKEIIIYGCGLYGIQTHMALEACGINIHYFCDSNDDLQGTTKFGIKILSPKELVENHKESLVIIATKYYCHEICLNLLQLVFDRKKIVIPEEGILRAVCGCQYFDYFNPEENEVFVDAGAYDGETTLEFVKWVDNDYTSIYALEPFETVRPVLEKNLYGIKNVNIIYKAAWDKNETLLFGGEAKAFEINGGDIAVSGARIDDIVGEEKVTFIKMDIEGSEYQALRGAENAIKRNKPKLAICIYHKPNDILTIPNLIEEMVPEYTFAIRHYCSGWIETVLYAWVQPSAS